MDHVLDNPVWNALLTGNKDLANGNEKAKYFAKEVSPFVGLSEYTPGNFHELHNITPAGRYAGIAVPFELTIPGEWKPVFSVRGLQMVFEGDTSKTNDEGLTVLTESNVPEMMELTKLTKPGPFDERTINFGHYKGIFDNGKLVAMAGQRLTPSPYAEVSAVCTHPDHLGKGYARRLIMQQVKRIQHAGEIPFLHVRDSNERAIKVYHDLGFATRTYIYFYFFIKKPIGNDI